MTKTIKVYQDTYDLLNARRIAGKTFDDVIQDLLGGQRINTRGIPP